MLFRSLIVLIFLIQGALAQTQQTYNCTCNTKLKDASGNFITLPQERITGINWGDCTEKCNIISRNKANGYFNGSTPRFSCPINPNPGSFTLQGASYVTEWNPGTVNLVYNLSINCYRTLTGSIDKAPNTGWRD
jgi:hypothetical protein